MSKVDAQRAMRQARYEALEAQASAARPAARAPSPRVATPEDAPVPAARGISRPAAAQARTEPAVAAVAEEQAAGEVLCGHRSIGNKGCQRPAGHAEKNHRYK